MSRKENFSVFRGNRYEYVLKKLVNTSNATKNVLCITKMNVVFVKTSCMAKNDINRGVLYGG
jgi:hypothetical protein